MFLLVKNTGRKRSPCSMPRPTIPNINLKKTMNTFEVLKAVTNIPINVLMPKI